MLHIFEKFNLLKKKKEIELLQPDIDSYLTYLAISKAIKANTPFLASRIGYTEARSLAYPAIFENPPQKIMDSLWHSSGVFPAEANQFRAFAQTYIEAAKNADLLGLMGYSYETVFIETHANHAIRCLLEHLNPFQYPYPWSMHLEGLDVLVVHPFAESISENYKTNRVKLFFDTRVLPKFNLITIKAPQTLVGNADGFKSWSQALDYLKNEVHKKSFDVALIGCGGYGLPIASLVKDLGKIALHLGGALQLLFGITGSRWDRNKSVAMIENKFWKRPENSERPKNWEKMENGCYW
jgi:hypothetical protein